MATEIEAAVLLTHKASELKNQGKNVCPFVRGR
jgi:hypothetical protein